MEKFLRVYVEIIVFFPLTKKLLPQSITAFVEILAHFKMLRPKIVKCCRALLEMIFEHNFIICCYIFTMYSIFD